MSGASWAEIGRYPEARIGDLAMWLVAASRYWAVCRDVERSDGTTVHHCAMGPSLKPGEKKPLLLAVGAESALETQLTEI